MATINKYDLGNFHPGIYHNPKHIGIIPDGTGRWAVRNKIEILEAYQKSMENMEEIVNYCFTQKCEAISIYLSSEQNFKRPKKIINAFCEAQNLFCSKIIPKVADKFSTRILLAGEKQLLPQFFQNTLDSIIKQTENNFSTRIYLCVAYNPISEILRATSKTEFPQDVISYLDVPEPLDLVIRTGCANLLSNFLPIQSGFARIYILNKLFPNVTINDIEKIYNVFRKLNRTYGV